MKSIMNFMKNKKARNWGIAILALLVIGLLARPLFSANATETAEAEAQVVALEVGETVSASGSLQAQPFASLAWKTSGVVEAVNATPGDLVQAGDILAALQPASTSSSIVSAKADLMQAQKDLEDLLKSDTERAQAAIDLKDAQDAYDTAYDYRIELNKKIWHQRVVNKYVRGRQITTIKWYRAYADAETIATADRNLALKKGELEDAQRAYERLEDGPNSQDVAAAQANVDAAQATVNSLNIIAPFDGEVLSMSDHVGDVVDSGDLSVNLADMNHLYVEAQVDESDIAKIKLGNKIEATLDAVPDLTVTGTVSAINPVGESDSGLVKYSVTVDLDQVDDSTFIPLGTTVNVTIQVKEAAQLLAVPITAIQNDSQGEFVLVIQEDGSSVRVNVVSGNIVGDLVAVTGDLQEGQLLSTVQSDASMGPGRGLFGGG